MSMLVARLLLGTGIVVATTVMRHEVRGRGEVQASLEPIDGNGVKAVHFAAGGAMMFIDKEHKRGRTSGDDAKVRTTKVVLQKAEVKETLSLQLSSRVKHVDSVKSHDCGDDGEACPDTCNDDFPLGNPNSTDCAEPTTHKIMDNPFMCELAARMANVTVIKTAFRIDLQDYGKFRPLGCFEARCSLHVQNGQGLCYFWNDYSSTPIDILGTPVCVRYKFRNGTVNSSAPDTNGVTCPGGYQHIIRENNCSLASVCEGACRGDPFIIPPSQRNQYPLGCFMHQENGCYYFNPLTDENGTAWALPNNASGWPLCNVSTVTRQGVAVEG